MEGAFAAPGAINNGLYSLNAYDYSLNHSEDTFDFGLLEAFNNDYDNQFNNTFEGTYNTQFNNTSEGTCNDQFSGAYEVQGRCNQIKGSRLVLKPHRTRT